jgi:probable HAF family extracellular repeat protein
MKSRSIRSVVLLSAALGIFVASEPAAAGLKFISFDVLGATLTRPTSINSLGAVAGYYNDKNGNAQGFVRAPDGTFTTITRKGAAATYVYGINDAGTVVGGYLSGGVYHAFLRTSDGTFTDIACPGGASGGALGINNKGVIAGGCGIDPQIGFVRDLSGNVTTFAPPNNGGTGVLFPVINSSGEIGGTYNTAKGQQLGFVREPDGTITTYNAGGGKNYTDAECLSDAGTSAGHYYNASPKHGFLRAADGAVTPYDLPQNGWQFLFGDPCGIDGNDRVVSAYQTKGVGNPVHGYLRSSDGTITEIDPFGSDYVLLVGINKKNVIAGYYQDSGGGHGVIVKGTP